jgi:MFS family permease
MFHVGRIVSGIGIGILVTVCLMYLSEISSPNVRGWLVGHHAIFLVLGYNGASWIGYGCYFATTLNESFAWRFPLLLLLATPWVPRSPRWLLSKGKAEDAWTVLQRLRYLRLRNSADDPNNIVAKEEYHQIREQLRLEAVKLASTGHNVWTAAWAKKSYRKRMIIGFLTQWGAEFAGPLVIVSLGIHFIYVLLLTLLE